MMEDLDKINPELKDLVPDDVVTQETQVRGLNASVSHTNHDIKRVSLKTIVEPLNEIRVHQHLDAVEVCLCWERNNRYSLNDSNGRQILYTYEAAQCYDRQCYGSLREFTLVTTDDDDNRLLKLHRPLKCSSRCFYACCDLQEMNISTPDDGFLGQAKERWSCCIPHYEVLDGEGKQKFTIEGTCCHFRCCCSISFVVKDMNKEFVSNVRKHFGGCKEIIGACNDFEIEYSLGLSSVDKILILGSVFLLDFNYFERHGKCF